VVVSAASPLQPMPATAGKLSNGQAFEQSFNNEYTRMASVRLNRACGREKLSELHR
jgi:hypothetical protein